MDMIGHQVILPLVFGCLAFSFVIRNENAGIVFLGIIATALVTPLTKMRDNELLLLSIATITRQDNSGFMDNLKDSQKSDQVGRKSLKKLILDFAGMLFSQEGIFYLLIFAVLLNFAKVYIIFYGIGIPFVFIPKCLVRLKALKRDANDPNLLKHKLRPEWLDK